MTPEEAEARRQDLIAALPMRHRIGRWWDIYGLPLVAVFGVLCLAGLAFAGLMRWLS